MKRPIPRFAALGVAATCSVLAGCATAVPRRATATVLPEARQRQPSAKRRVPAKPTPVRRSIARLAIDLVGTPYRYGGTTPEQGFDCSGLVFYTYEHNGLKVPRTSAQLFRRAKKIALSQARQGDLVFFEDQTKLSHVGIYLGHDLFVHAPSTGHTVTIASLDTPYYHQHLVAVGRILSN